MKKIKVILPLILFSYLSSAQPGFSNRLEIGIGTGYISTDYLFDGRSPGFGVGVGLKDYVNHRYSGTYFLTLKYFISKRFSLSIIAAYENESGDWQQNVNTGGAYDWQTIPLGTFRRQAFTFAPEMSVYYSNNGIVRTYCSLGLGLTYRNEVDKYSQEYYNQNYQNGVNSLGNDLEMNNNKVQGNFYFSPFGFSIGNKVCWFAEIGIGYKGIINTGLSVKL